MRLFEARFAPSGPIAATDPAPTPPQAPWGKGKSWAVAVRRHRAAGMALAETLIAVTIVSIGFLGAFATGLQARRMVSAAEEDALVCAALEQRIEQLRLLDWPELTGGGGLTAKVWTARPEPTADVSILAETLTISAWDVPGAQALQGVWAGVSPPTVNFTAGAQDLSTAVAVKVIATLTWNSRRAGRPMSRTLVTVISKGGISKSDPL